MYLLLFLFTLKRRKEFSEGYESLLPVSVGQSHEDEADAMVVATMNPITGERDRTFSDFINSFGARQPSTDPARVYRSSVDGRDPDNHAEQQSGVDDDSDELTPLRSMSVA